MKRNIYILGNLLIKSDSLPLKLLPKLKKKFPLMQFIVFDPSEELLDMKNNELIIVDTVLGLKKVSVFHNLDNFSLSPRVTVHDFDLSTNLKLLQKVGKLTKITIIGVPPEGNHQTIFRDICTILTSI